MLWPRENYPYRVHGNSSLLISVYNCPWSHAGGMPVHTPYVVQPVTTDQMARFGARGPDPQTAMFASGGVPDPDEAERVSDHAPQPLWQA